MPDRDLMTLEGIGARPCGDFAALARSAAALWSQTKNHSHLFVTRMICLFFPFRIMCVCDLHWAFWPLQGTLCLHLALHALSEHRMMLGAIAANIITCVLSGYRFSSVLACIPTVSLSLAHLQTFQLCVTMSRCAVGSRYSCIIFGMSEPPTHFDE